MFDLLSGISHGKTWANLAASSRQVLKEYLSYSADGSSAPSDIVLATNAPNAAAMILLIQLLILQVEDALTLLQRAQDASAP